MVDNQSNLPLTEATFYILFSLAIEPRHGYSIIKEVEQLSEGRVRMAAGTLYGAAKRLLEDGWIERTDKKWEAVADNRDRKSYRLTREGQFRLREEMERIKHLAGIAKKYQQEVNI